MSVPAEWLLGAALALIGVVGWGFAYFIRTNDRDHERIFGILRDLEKKQTGILHRIMHLMASHKPEIPPYPEGDDE